MTTEVQTTTTTTSSSGYHTKPLITNTLDAKVINSSLSDSSEDKFYTPINNDDKSKEAGKILSHGDLNAVIDLYEKFGNTLSLPMGGALHYAASNKQHPEVLYYLLTEKNLAWQINIKDQYDYLPLEWATLAKNINGIRILIAHGAKYEGIEFKTAPSLLGVLYNNASIKTADDRVNLENNRLNVITFMEKHKKGEDLTGEEKLITESVIKERRRYASSSKISTPTTIGSSISNLMSYIPFFTPSSNSASPKTTLTHAETVSLSTDKPKTE